MTVSARSVATSVRTRNGVGRKPSGSRMRLLKKRSAVVGSFSGASKKKGLKFNGCHGTFLQDPIRGCRRRGFDNVTTVRSVDRAPSIRASEDNVDTRILQNCFLVSSLHWAFEAKCEVLRDSASDL